MDTPHRKPTKESPSQHFTVKAIPIPAGQRPKVKTMQRIEDEARRRWFLFVTGLAISMLGIGAVIGRFLLP